MSLQTRLAELIEAIGADVKELVTGKVNTNDSRLSNSREWNAATVPRAEAEAGTAATRRAWTAARVRQSMRAGILGTVSQEAGVPTGAIIERGSNASGEYVRFADGTQICWIRDSISVSFSGAGEPAVYPGYYLYPAAFASGEPRTEHMSTNDSHLIVTSYGAINSTSTAYVVIKNMSGDNYYSTSCTLMITAVGRWF